MRLLPAVLALAPLWSSLGCGVSTDNGTAQQSADVQSSNVVPDAGIAGTPLPTALPSFAPAMAVVQSHGGMVEKSPTAITVTWDGDANRSAYESFVDTLGTTSYWATLSEYNVGVLHSTSANHVHAKTPLPRSMDISDIDAYVAAHVSKDWPAFNTENVYLLFIPANIFVSATELGAADACDVVDGYHTEINAGPSGHVPYMAIIGRCHAHEGQAELGDETRIASHELIETTTDPHTRSDLGYIGFGGDSLGWELFQSWQDEIADACEFYPNDAFIPAGMTSVVERFWSNNAAAHGHDPCVPAAPGPYYNSTPLNLQSISVTTKSGGKPTPTKGYRVAPGTTATFSIGLYSDAPTDGWSITAVEGDGSPLSGRGRLSLALSSPVGKDGDIVKLTVTASSLGDSHDGTADLVTLVAWNGVTAPHYMPVVIGIY